MSKGPDLDLEMTLSVDSSGPDYCLDWPNTDTKVISLCSCWEVRSLIESQGSNKKKIDSKIK